MVATSLILILKSTHAHETNMSCELTYYFVSSVFQKTEEKYKYLETTKNSTMDSFNRRVFSLLKSTTYKDMK